MSSPPRLTETSYIVLGLVEFAEPATPYDLKQMAQLSTVEFWAIPHTQLYAECTRLAKEGLLSERREETGRRRRVLRLTKAGRKTLKDWLAEPTDQLYEVRDPGTLKLFFGGDPAMLATAQLAAHKRRLKGYKQLSAEIPDMPNGMRLALEAGMGHERECIRFWSKVDKEASSK